jgi:hypothetical protein
MWVERPGPGTCLSYRQCIYTSDGIREIVMGRTDGCGYPRAVWHLRNCTRETVGIERFEWCNSEGGLCVARWQYWGSERFTIVSPGAERTLPLRAYGGASYQVQVRISAGRAQETLRALFDAPQPRHVIEGPPSCSFRDGTQP